VDGHLRMVAAVQPLLSRGVSKTLNLPGDTTPERSSRSSSMPWRMEPKSIAVDRQGSKVGQPLDAVED
jgi:ribonucleoside-diphosphate reductase alpha chain